MESYCLPFTLVSLEEASSLMPMVETTIAGIQTHLVIDTGASHTCMDKGIVKKFKTDLEESKDNAVIGIGGRRLMNCICMVPDLQIGDFHIESYRVVAVRMSHINKALAKLGCKPIGGLLGSDFLSRFKAVINYETGILHLSVT